MSTKLSPKLTVSVLLLAAGAWAGILWQQMRHGPAQQHIDAGNEAARKGDGPGAISEWRKATELEPNNPLPWQLLAQSFYDAGIWRQAKDALLNVERLTPNSPHIASSLATCSRNLGEMEDALKYGRAELKRNPEDIPALNACVAALAQNHQGAAPELLADLRTLNRLEPDNSQHAIQLAKTLIAENNPKEAIPVADQILTRDPNNAEIYALRGFSRFFADGSPEGTRLAEADLLQARKLKPSLYISDLYLGKLYRRRDDWKQAAKYLEAATRLDPNKNDPYYDLAAVYNQLHQPERATAALRRYEENVKREEMEKHKRRREAAESSQNKSNTGGS